jgi:hypothetical protein
MLNEAPIALGSQGGIVRMTCACAIQPSHCRCRDRDRGIAAKAVLRVALGEFLTTKIELRSIIHVFRFFLAGGTNILRID